MVTRNPRSGPTWREIEEMDRRECAVIADLGHVCHDHPTTFREALITVGTKHRADDILRAITMRLRQPHDPFEGL